MDESTQDAQREGNNVSFLSRRILPRLHSAFNFRKQYPVCGKPLHIV